MELNKIYNEDCLEGMKRIPDKSIDMILCDLPYGTTKNKWDSVIPFQPLWEQYKRICRDNAAIVLFSQQPFTTKLIESNIDDFRYEWIWEKPQGTGFLNANKMPLKRHENIVVFYGKLPTYNPQYTFSKIIIRSKESKYISQNYNNKKLLPYNNPTGKRYPTDILNFYDKQRFNSTKEKNRHPTQKPVDLIAYLIKTYTDEGMTVLDNCMGSGTTAVACINTNRNYIGFEIDKEYFDLSIKRINDIRKEPKLEM